MRLLKSAIPKEGWNGVLRVGLIAGLLFSLLAGEPARSASCCGGGASSELMLPKHLTRMVGAQISLENDRGYWDHQAEYHPPAPDSSGVAYKTGFGYAQRLGKNIQGFVSLPWSVNHNRYGKSGETNQGPGDVSVGAWYEWFEAATCVYRVRSLADLKPAIFTGISQVIPTGVSPYSAARSNFAVTGTGFYRSQARALVEKTVFPVSLSWSGGYSYAWERPINREYGHYIEPYRRQDGDRFESSISLAWTYMLDSMAAWTARLGWGWMSQSGALIDGRAIPDSRILRNSVLAGLAFAPARRYPVVRWDLTWSPSSDRFGKNTQKTIVFLMGMDYGIL